MKSESEEVVLPEALPTRARPFSTRTRLPREGPSITTSSIDGMLSPRGSTRIREVPWNEVDMRLSRRSPLEDSATPARTPSHGREQTHAHCDVGVAANARGLDALRLARASRTRCRPARTREKARGSCGGPTVAEWGATASHRDPSRARASKSDASRRGIARSDEGKEPANEEFQREVQCRGPGARGVGDGRVLGGRCSRAGRLGEPPAFRGRGRPLGGRRERGRGGRPDASPRPRPLRPPRPRSRGSRS